MGNEIINVQQDPEGNVNNLQISEKIKPGVLLKDSKEPWKQEDIEWLKKETKILNDKAEQAVDKATPFLRSSRPYSDEANLLVQQLAQEINKLKEENLPHSKFMDAIFYKIVQYNQEFGTLGQKKDSINKKMTVGEIAKNSIHSAKNNRSAINELLKY